MCIGTREQVLEAGPSLGCASPSPSVLPVLYEKDLTELRKQHGWSNEVRTTGLKESFPSPVGEPWWPALSRGICSGEIHIQKSPTQTFPEERRGEKKQGTHTPVHKIPSLNADWVLGPLFRHPPSLSGVGISVSSLFSIKFSSNGLLVCSWASYFLVGKTSSWVSNQWLHFIT